MSRRILRNCRRITCRNLGPRRDGPRSWMASLKSSRMIWTSVVEVVPVKALMPITNSSIARNSRRWGCRISSVHPPSNLTCTDTFSRSNYTRPHDSSRILKVTPSTASVWSRKKSPSKRNRGFAQRGNNQKSTRRWRNVCEGTKRGRKPRRGGRRKSLRTMATNTERERRRRIRENPERSWKTLDSRRFGRIQISKSTKSLASSSCSIRRRRTST